MKKQKTHAQSILSVAVISIWILFLLSYVAIRFNIYYTLTWFDTLMHFFGGVVSALVVYVILSKLKLPISTNFKSFLVIVFGVVVVGFGWEVVEYVVNYYIPTYTFDIVDTTVDMIADTIGAIVSAALILNHKKKNHYGN